MVDGSATSEPLTVTVVPILPARDMDESLAFYARLGFVLRASWYGQSYCIVQGAGVELHLFRQATLDPESNLCGVYLRLADVSPLHRRWSQLGLPEEGAAPRLLPLEDKSWGMREFAIVDPSGNLLRVGSPLPRA